MINLNITDTENKQHSLNLSDQQFEFLFLLVSASSRNPEISTMSIGNTSVIRLASSQEDDHYERQEADASIKELRIWTGK